MLAFDTLQVAKDLATAFARTLTVELATKRDLADVETRLRVDIQEVGAEFRAEIQEVRGEIQSVRGDIQDLKVEIVNGSAARCSRSSASPA